MMKKKRTLLFLSALPMLFTATVFTFCAVAHAQDNGRVPDGFMELSLEDCVKFSIHNSFKVKLAKLDLLVAETDRLYAEAVFDTIAFGDVGYSEDKRQQISVFAPDNSQTNIYSFGISKELPSGTEITAEWGDTRDWVDSPFVTRNPAHSAELTLEARQPVGRNTFGYIDRKTVSVTKLAIRNAALQEQDEIEEQIARTEKAYWNLVFAKRSLDIRRNILEKAENLNETNVKSYDMGIIEKGDLYASQANVLIRVTELHLAENAYKRAEEDLKLIMNMPEVPRIYPGDVFRVRRMNYDLANCLKVAFDRRRDYKIRKRDVDIKKITLKMKDNQKWPEVDLVASMAMNGVESKFSKAAGKTTVADNTYYYAGVEVSWPIENSMARSEYQKAGFEKEKSVVALKETERTIITEVGNSYRDVITYDANVDNIAEAVELQSEKLQEEEKRFKYGRSKTKTLIDYQHDLLNTEMGQARVLLDREKARVELERDMNVILQKYEVLI